MEICGHYIRGPPGSGKSMLACLLARELQLNGHKVYFIEHADFLSKHSKQQIINAEATVKENEKIFLIVDEVQQNVNDGLWNYLLKVTRKTITIGFGIPRIEDISISPDFEKKYPPSFMFFNEGDINAEMLSIFLKFTTAANNIGSNKADEELMIQQVIEDALKWTLSFTGGHAFAFLTISEFIITKHFQACKDKDFEFLARSFIKSDLYRRVVGRCFKLSCCRY
jgi:hypothetical protein